jgi:hypothetical protein
MVVILNGPGQNGYRQLDPWKKGFMFPHEVSTTPETVAPQYIVKYGKMKDTYAIENQNVIEPPARVQTIGRPPNPLVFNAPIKTEPTVKPEPTPVTNVTPPAGPENGGGGGDVNDFNSLFRLLGDSVNFISSTALNAVQGGGQAVGELVQTGENVATSVAETLAVGVDEIMALVAAARQRIQANQLFFRIGGTLNNFLRNPTTRNERLALDYVQRYIVPTLPGTVPEPLIQIGRRVYQEIRGTNTPYVIALINALTPMLQGNVQTLPEPTQAPVGLIGSSRGTARDAIQNLTNEMSALSIRNDSVMVQQPINRKTQNFIFAGIILALGRIYGMRGGKV